SGGTKNLFSGRQRYQRSPPRRLESATISAAAELVHLRYGDRSDRRPDVLHRRQRKRSAAREPGRYGLRTAAQRYRLSGLDLTVSLHALNRGPPALDLQFTLC